MFNSALSRLDTTVLRVFGQPVSLSDGSTVLGVLQDRLKEPTIGTISTDLIEPILIVDRASAKKMRIKEVVTLVNFGYTLRYQIVDQDIVEHDSLITFSLRPAR